MAWRRNGPVQSGRFHPAKWRVRNGRITIRGGARHVGAQTKPAPNKLREGQMSGELCLGCGELVPVGSDKCPNCGFAMVRSPAAGSPRGGLHPLSPVVFLVAALAVGAAATLAVSLALGIPLGLLGGGIGVWMLERGRRLR